jgi:hypothetical protein
MVIAAPGSAAGPEKVYETQFTAQCILAPGVLNEPGAIAFTVRGEGPESVGGGQEFSLRNEKISFTIPQRWGEALFGIGVREIKGRIVRFPLDAEHGTPSQVNDAEPSEFPTGVPFQAHVENGAVEFAAPGEGTLVSPPVMTSGPSGLGVSVDAAPGFREVSSGHYESTNEGIQLELTGFSEPEPGKLEKVIGPLQVSCTAPSGVAVAKPVEGPPCPPEVTSVEPSHGNALAGVTVQITGCGFEGASSVTFGQFEAKSFTVNSPTSITAVTPTISVVVPLSMMVSVRVGSHTSTGGPFFTFEPPPPPPPPSLTAVYSNWPLSGSLTPKKLGQAIILPAGSTFSGSAEARPRSSPGPGKLTGSVSIPPFTAPIKLFGLFPVSLGVTLTQAGPLEGAILTNGIGNATLTIPAKLNLSITSIGVALLRLPLSCATAEPLALELATRTVVGPEELLAKGWTFSGTTTLPSFKCAGPFGSLVGSLLSALLSGPESAYALRISPPGG